MSAKTVALIAVVVLAIVLALCFGLPKGGHHYCATAKVLVSPTTNVNLTASLLTMPGVRLVQTSNSPVILVMSIASDPQEAQIEASNATGFVCTEIQRLYGRKAAIIQQAGKARRYSIFHDGPLPDLKRQTSP